MCGIAGIISFKQQDCSHAIRQMTSAMAHRGPDADGFFADDTVFLGHRRLSIIDLSEAANQPLFDHTGNYVIVFNGEIYNYQQLKSQLNGYPFKTNGDTEAVLAAYIRWGKDCLQYLKGMFAFAIWNKETKELFTVRDRMGVKPLYYYKDDNYLIFASELRSVLASGLVKAGINQAALASYFAYQSFYTPETLINNIAQLPAASWMLAGPGRFEQGVYWSVTANSEPLPGTDKASVQKEVRRLLVQSVERRMVSDVPVAAFLSGGIDSGAVVGLMAEIAASPQTFTIGFDEKEFDESSYAKVIAQKFNTRHHNILLKPGIFLDELDNALNSMDSPSGDGINTYVVSKAIRKENIKVALSGVGGDELFAGYPIFNQWLGLENKKWLWKFPGFVRSLLASFKGGSSSKDQRTRALLKLPACDMAGAYPLLRQVIPGGTLQKLLKIETNHTALQQTLNFQSSAINKFPLLSQVSVAEYLGYTQHTLLKDTDQMSMAVSLEVREPFFDHELIEYVLRVPDAVKKGTYAKSLLVESLGDMLPPEIVHRKKQGFLLPWSVWMKNELQTFCKTHIDSMAQREFVNGDALRQHWQRFTKGDETVRWAELWLFVVLDRWLQKHSIQ
jgi:asparagine synthase (glutamine-hydrolysing)